nr:MAG TPA: hypothetical protein [Caudoviricetes sp.]
MIQASPSGRVLFILFVVIMAFMVWKLLGK